jgi:hypothetical protein
VRVDTPDNRVLTDEKRTGSFAVTNLSYADDDSVFRAFLAQLVVKVGMGDRPKGIMRRDAMRSQLMISASCSIVAVALGCGPSGMGQDT